MATGQPIVIGVDIGGTKVHAASFDHDFTVVDEVRASTATNRLADFERSAADAADAADAAEDMSFGEALVDQIIQIVGELAKVSERPLAGVGIGCPGVIDRSKGTIRAAVNLGIRDEPLDLVNHIAEAFGVFCTLDNDVNIAALGARQLLDPSAPDLAYLSIGTGLAAGIILDGRLHRGRTGVAGEIGHFPVDPAGPRCECGLNGCLEVLASGTAISRQWPAVGDISSAAGLFAAADGGSPEAIAIRQRFGHHLALAAYLIAISYDIDMIVVGGGVAELGHDLLDLMRQELDQIGKGSAFARSLAVGDRLVLRPDGSVGPTGAAVLAANDLGWSLT